MGDWLAILIADEDGALARSLQDTLMREGYQVIAVEDAERAIDACETEQIDLVLADMKLANATPGGLIARLAEVSPSTECIIMSEQATLEGAMAAVADKRIVGYETKPLDMGHLLNLLNQIVERRKAEAALHLERDQARRYLDIAGVIMVALNARGEVTLINRKGCEVLGYSEEEVLGKKWFREFVPEMVRREVEGVFKEVMKGKRGEAPGYYENPVLTKDGRERLIGWHNTVLTDETGAVTGTLSSGEDITERRRVEDQLKLEAQLLDGATDSIFLHDLDGKLLYTNESAYRSRGYSKDELMEMNVNALETRKSNRRAQHKRRQLLRRGYVTFESAHVRRDHSIMPVEVKARVIESGDRRLVLSVTRDITERKKGEQDLERSYRRLRRAMEGTTTAFEVVTEMRDPYTSGHQRRVTKLALAIAREMGLPRERVEVVQMAGSIHDIGKMYVPAEILSKPGQLSDIEFSLIKIHPRAGHDILRAAQATWPVAEMVLQHHERMDGSGYPRGLAGERILLEARILSVADVVEAMSSHRPYRPALPLDHALQEIADNSGVLYDPGVVDACTKLFTGKRFTLT